LDKYLGENMAESSEDTNRVNCPQCSKKVGDNSRAVACEICNSWVHHTCAGLSDGVYKAIKNMSLNKNIKSGLHWFCGECNEAALESLRGEQGIQAVLEDEQGSQAVLEDEEGTWRRIGGSDLDEVEKGKKGKLKEWERVKEEIDGLKQMYKRNQDKSEKEMVGFKKEMEEIKKENRILKREGEETKDIVRQMQKEAVSKKEVGEMNSVVVGIRKENEELKQLWADVVIGNGNGGVGSVAVGNEVGRENRLEGSIEGNTGEENNVREVRKLKAEVTEAIDRENRKKNLIIMGLDEGTEETENESDRISEIFKDLLEGAPVRIGGVERIGKQGDKARHVKVTIEDNYARRKILAAAKNLKEKSVTKKVFIVPDLTRLQQENDKKLRDKIRELRTEGVQNIKIQKGQIIKAEGIEKEVLFSIEQ